MDAIVGSSNNTTPCVHLPEERENLLFKKLNLSEIQRILSAEPAAGPCSSAII
jgi:hypothetical protein